MIGMRRETYHYEQYLWGYVRICGVGDSCGLWRRVREYSIACIVSDSRVEVFRFFLSDFFSESREAGPSCRLQRDARQSGVLYQYSMDSSISAKCPQSSVGVWVLEIFVRDEVTKTESDSAQLR
jgi:hypothetical protein